MSAEPAGVARQPGYSEIELPAEALMGRTCVHVAASGPSSRSCGTCVIEDGAFGGREADAGMSAVTERLAARPPAATEDDIASCHGGEPSWSTSSTGPHTCIGPFSMSLIRTVAVGDAG